MHSTRLFYLFSILLSIQLSLSLSTCPQNYALTSENGQQICVPQVRITVNIRPMPEFYSYTLVFEGGKVPFTSISDFKSNTFISLSSATSPTLNGSQPYISQALTSDLTVIQILLPSQQIPYGTKIIVSFNDFTTDDSRSSFIAGPVELALPTSKQITGTELKLLDIANDVDYILEFVWMGFSLLNPYWILYMDCKLYRETLNFLKHVTVQYEPFLSTFYMTNHKRVSGIRSPNIFGMLLLDNPFSSEWEKFPGTNSGYNYVSSNRIDDLKVLADPRVHQYNRSPLFLDNYGVELTIIACSLVVVLFTEFVCWLFKLNEVSTGFSRFIYKSKQAVWNFILMTILGSAQSLVFYTPVQIQAFLSENTLHNKISFGIAIGTFILTVLSVGTYIFGISKKKNKNLIQDKVFKTDPSSIEGSKKPLGFFTPVLDFYKTGKFSYTMAICVAVPRAISFSVATLMLGSSPIAQVAGMLAATVTAIAGLVSVRPYVRPLYTAFKVMYEFVLLGVLGILLFLVIRDSNNNFNLNERGILGIALIGLWLAVPVLTIIFAVLGLLHYVKCLYTGNKQAKQVVPVSKPSSGILPQEKEEKDDGKNVKRRGRKPKKLPSRKVVPEQSNNETDSFVVDVPEIKKEDSRRYAKVFPSITSLILDEETKREPSRGEKKLKMIQAQNRVRRQRTKELENESESKNEILREEKIDEGNSEQNISHESENKLENKVNLSMRRNLKVAPLKVSSLSRSLKQDQQKI